MVSVIVILFQNSLLSQRNKKYLNFSFANVYTLFFFFFLNTCKSFASILSYGKEFPSLNTLYEEISPFVHLKFVTCKLHLLFLVLVLVATGINCLLFTLSMPVMILEILTT